MYDLLGPGDAGATPVLSTTSDVTYPQAGETWFQNCTGNIAGTGTPFVQKFMNRLMQQVRRVIQLSGIAQANTNDDMLGQAIQSGAANFAAAGIGGAVNAYTAALSPLPAVQGGLLIRGVVGAGLTNTGAATLNGLPITHFDGGALVGGEIVAGDTVEFLDTGAAYVMMTSNDAWTNWRAVFDAAEPGYLKLPNGFILQWGTVANSGGASSHINWTFPVTFPNALLWAIGADTAFGGTSTYQTVCWDGSDSTASAARFYKSGAGASTASVLAIGY